MSNVNLRRMTVEDVDGVHAIEEATFAKPWSRQSFSPQSGVLYIFLQGSH